MQKLKAFRFFLGFDVNMIRKMNHRGALTETLIQSSDNRSEYDLFKQVVAETFVCIQRYSKPIYSFVRPRVIDAVQAERTIKGKNDEGDSVTIRTILLSIYGCLL